MADFDPDAYLAKVESKSTGSGFDPDAYLAKIDAKPKEKDLTWYQKLERQAELTGRAAAQGIASTIDIPAAIVNPIINKVAGTSLSPTPMQESYNNLFNQVGLAKPETPTERVVQSAVGGLTGGLGGARVAGGLASAATSPLAKQLLSTLASAPATQAASGAASGAAGQSVSESGGGKVAQTLASLVAGATPFSSGGVSSALKSALRGSDQNIPEILSRTKTFQEAGATNPSVGQVTGSRVSQALESALSKVPGSAGVMAKAAEKESAEIGQKATEIADRLSTIGTPANAGRAIEKGISGENGFIPRFKQAQTSLYDKLDKFVPKQANVDVSNTKATLAAMNADIPNAPSLSKWFKNAKIQGIEQAMSTDLNPDKTVKNPLSAGSVSSPEPVKTTLPYESIKKLRSLVGAELDNPSLASDVPRSQWKRLYGSLSSDLEGAAKATGNPEAVKAMNRANAFTKAGYDRIESVLDKVVGKNTPEEIFKSATSSSDMQAGATKISSVMKSLEPAERDVVKSAFVRRMGQATAGNQGSEGGTFSTQAFLTNWNKISPQAKSVLFSSKDNDLRKSLDQIAKASEYIKEGSKVFSNPSGTAQATALTGGVASVAGAIGTGQLHTAATLLGGMGAANLTAKLMTNPKFTTWLAKSSEIPQSVLPSAILALRNSIKKEPDDVKNDVDTYLESIENNPKSVHELMKGTQ